MTRKWLKAVDSGRKWTKADGSLVSVNQTNDYAPLIINHVNAVLFINAWYPSLKYDVQNSNCRPLELSDEKRTTDRT